jgi:hypothetical protein
VEQDDMPVLYHGTNRPFATTMAAGAVDVTRGGGEFGRGFYTQDSSGNAARRGQYLYGNNSAVLILTLDDRAYHALNFRRLTLSMAQALNARLRAGNARQTYVTPHDALVGPLVYQPRIEQQKFQSANAQDLLNGLLTQRTVK